MCRGRRCARSPRRCRPCPRCPGRQLGARDLRAVRSPSSSTVKPSRSRIAVALGLRDVDAGQALRPRSRGNRRRALGAGRAPATTSSRRLAAAEFEDQLRRELEARQSEGGIDAALEAIARVGDDAELAAGVGDVVRVPQAPLSISTSVVSSSQPEASPPMTPAMRFDAIVVGDDDHGLVERIGLAVERQQRFRRSWRGARRDRPSTFFASKTCSGRPRSKVRKLVMSTSALIGRRPMLAQALLQPVGARAVLDAAHEAQARRSGARCASSGAKSSVTPTGQGNLPATGATVVRPSARRARRRRDRARCRGRRPRRGGWA